MTEEEPAESQPEDEPAAEGAESQPEADAAPDESESAPAADEDTSSAEAASEPDDPEAQAESVEEEPAEDAETEGIEHGDVVRVDFSAFTVEEGHLVDTTDRSVAEDEGVADDEQTFEPRVLVIGDGHLFEPVEEALVGLDAGETATVTISPEEAFGEQDPDQVRTVSADKIPEDERYPGAHVDVDGDHGFVETIIGGRARVDFNHPFAGEEIEYEVAVMDVLDDRDELAEGLLKTYLDTEVEFWFQTDEVEVEVPPASDGEDAEEADEADDAEADESDEEADDIEAADEEPVEPETEIQTLESLYIEATPQLTMNQQWMFGKQQIAAELTEKLDIDRIVVQEILESRDQMLGGPGDMLAQAGLEDIEAELEE